jgi:uncharacterized protein
MVEVRESDGVVTFSVRVQPRASRSEIVGEWQGSLRARLAAAPVDDKANEELRRLLADDLNVTIAAVKILSGHRSRSKRVEVRGVSAAQIVQLAGTK